jgi:membrane protease subunit HflK
MKLFGNAIERGVLAMTGRKSPWGGDREGETPEVEGEESPDSDRPTDPPKGPRNPWLPSGETPPRRSASIEDIFKPRDPQRRGSGGGGGFPHLPRRPDGGSWIPAIAGLAVLVWLGATTIHVLGPKEQAVVTTFGKYTHTIQPGVSLTLPWPIQSVDTEDVTSIRRDTIPDSDTEKLMLTSDQSLVDLSYLVRWNIKNLKLYKFQLEKPADTVKEVAEAAMRASVAEVPLNEVMGGTGRAQIEQNVRQRMQAVLDAYHAGVLIQGVDIKKTDPPEKVVAAFQGVSAAQQDAQRDISNAQAWAQQLIAQAQGSAAQFDKVYEQYKLAPEVTKRRMYYETMERVLSNNDKVIVGSNNVMSYLPLPEMRRKPADAGQQPQPQQGGQ